MSSTVVTAIMVGDGMMMMMSDAEASATRHVTHVQAAAINGAIICDMEDEIDEVRSSHFAAARASVLWQALKR